MGTISRVSQRTTPDAWAIKNRSYPNTAGVPGPRNPFLTPYMVPWGRAVASGEHPLVVMVCSAQTGKTDTALDIIGERLDHHPAPVIYVGPSKEFCTDQFEPRLMDLLDNAKTLTGKVVRGRAMKKTRKLVAGVPIRLAHAGSSTALKSDPAAIAIVDEYDEMIGNIHGRGDPLGLVRARGHTFADFVTAVASTPTSGSSDIDERDGLQFWKRIEPEDLESPIWTLWQEGTRQHWAWPCPECGEYFIPRFSTLKWEGETPADARRTAHLECVHCGCVIESKSKLSMNDRGVYVSPGQKVDKDGNVSGPLPDTSTVSFWVSGLCSPFTKWGEVAEDYLSSVRMGAREKVQTCINAKFGELFSPGWGSEAPKWSEVAEHKAPYFKGELPDGVQVLIASVDVQKNRLIYVTRGWGARATSWLLDWGEFHGETIYDEVWTMLADYISNNICGLPLRLCMIDTGFRPGKREETPLNRVYDFCRQFPRIVRATKGSSSPMQLPLKVSKIEVNRKGTALRYGLELARLDSDHWKSWVHERLRWPTDQLGAWHLPEDVDDDYMKQIVAESRSRLPSGKVLWIEHSKENHFLDCEAMNAAGAHIMSMARLAPGVERRAAPPVPATPPAAMAVSPLTQAATRAQSVVSQLAK